MILLSVVAASRAASRAPSLLLGPLRYLVHPTPRLLVVVIVVSLLLTKTIILLFLAVLRSTNKPRHAAHDLRWRRSIQPQQPLQGLTNIIWDAAPRDWI